MVWTTIGALIGLGLSIFLIIKKLNPTYSLILGAVVGGIIGGIGLSIDGTINVLEILPHTVDSMIGSTAGTGIRGVVPAILRILTAGVLAGVLIETKAADVLSQSIIKIFGAKLALLALALSAMVLTAVGVFVDVAIVTIAPIALTVAKQTHLSPMAMLLALVGGGKAGNMISPNPNTIITSSNLNVPLFDLMLAGLPSAIVGIALSVLLSMWLNKRYKAKNAVAIAGDVFHLQTDEDIDDLPKLWAALVAPLVVIVLLALNPILSSLVDDAPSTIVDPLIALPIGGIVGCICMKKAKYLGQYVSQGILKMTPTAIMFVGTGAISGIIQASNLSNDIISLFSKINLSVVWFAPLAGILFSAATASTTAASTIASASFNNIIDGKLVFVDGSISNLSAAAMLHTGSATLDHLPHGTFFHATGGSVNMTVKERLRLIPLETVIGVCMTVVSTLVYGFFIK